MKFISIKEAMKKGSGKVAIRGWVYRERGSNKFKFIVLRDVSDIIQCVIKKEKFGEDKFKEADKIQIECSTEIIGTIKPDKRAPTGFEIDVDEFTVVGWSDNFPISKHQSPEFLLDKKHLSLRMRRLSAIAKVKSTVLKAFREFYYKEGFYEAPMPILQPIQCEGGSTLFGVKYYDKQMYLAQSWQLYAEAMIFSLEKIFCIAPTFRAEKSKTSRHLSEFWMAEMEAAWYKLPELLNSAERCVEYIVKKVLDDNLEELKFLGAKIDKLKKVKVPFPRMTYTEVLEFLEKKEGKKIPWGKDLRTIEEDLLGKYFDKPVIITHYPKEIMAFYKPKDPDNPKVALCVDMIAPGGYGEIIGGSQRDLSVKDMTEMLKSMGEKPEDYDWYFDLRKYGSVPHSGYGLGVERVVAWICNSDNIKDVVAFPRTMLRFKP